MVLELYRKKQQEVQEAVDTVQDNKFPIKWQRKILPSNLSNTDTDVASLQFNDLTIGKTYKIGGTIQATATNAGSWVNFYSGAGATGTLYGSIGSGENSAAFIYSKIGINLTFVATSTTMYARTQGFSAGSETLYGDGTVYSTHINLEECPNHVETTDWN